MRSDRIIIIGAGPAGMGCAYTLAKAGKPSLVFEKNSQPGGLCRTLNHKGYFFDIGGHRFLSKSEEINQLWQEVLDNDLLKVRRLSRIYYRKKYFKYPLSFFDTLGNLGLFESFLCLASYLKYKFISSANDKTFEGWVINHFGKRLYNIFFKTYTEKIWSLACKDISADWARQRIKGLSLKVAIKKALLGTRVNSAKTLSEEFLYPKTGPGEFCHRLKVLASQLHAQFKFEEAATAIKHNGMRVLAFDIQDLGNGRTEELSVDYLFSSIPLPVLIRILTPPPPQDIICAANKLRFRSFLAVNIIVDKEHVFPDQWIYIHSPEVKLSRIQNYKNWSPAMVNDYKNTSLGLEYFCNEGDNFWNMDDAGLINYALQELQKLGIVSKSKFIDGFVVRYPNAYPIYTLDYQKSVWIIRKYLEQFINLQTMGRAGLFRYDNSDHALLTGIYAARNFLGKRNYDLWQLNPDEGYLEF